MGKSGFSFIITESGVFVAHPETSYILQESIFTRAEKSNSPKMREIDRKMILMMSDLRGFTALTANMKPEKVITFLNRYLGKMVDILMAHRGVIDEIIGNGILAFFGAPESLEDHTSRAVACALEMQTAMAEINVENQKEALVRTTSLSPEAYPLFSSV